MKKIIGGSIAVILGLFCLSVFFSAFLSFLAGIAPLMLIIVGCLIIYLKRESPDCGDARVGWKYIDITETSSLTVTTEPVPADVGTEKTESTETEPNESDDVETKPVKTKSTEAVPVETKPGETAPAAATLNLLGNTGSLVFHNFDCKFSKSKNCTAVFNTKDKAIQEGYKPCGICKP